MAAYGSVSITGGVSGFPSGSKSINFALSSANAVGDITDVVLNAGDNTIPVPSGAKMVFIDPPEGNTAVLRLKGPATDTGFHIHSSLVSFFPLADDVSVLLINSSGVTSGPVLFNWI